jgi:mRNA-degrading endonuclease toxin of MazEF toxin-antitoxin module
MVVTGKMNYLVDNLLTSFEKDLIKELNRQRLDAEVIISNHAFLDSDERVIINIAATQFIAIKTGTELKLRVSSNNYPIMYDIEVLVTYIRKFAKDELEKKIRYFECKRKQFGD